MYLKAPVFVRTDCSAPIVDIITATRSRRVPGAVGPVGWSVGTAEKWPQSCGSGPGPDGRPIQPRDSIPFFFPSQTRWRPLQWPERPERAGVRESERGRGGVGGGGAVGRVCVSRLSKISNYHNCWNLFSLLFSCFLIQKAPSQHALQALPRIPIREQTVSHKTERPRERGRKGEKCWEGKERGGKKTL